MVLQSVGDGERGVWSNRLNNSLTNSPLGFVTRCHTKPYPLYGTSETGQRTTHTLGTWTSHPAAWLSATYPPTHALGGLVTTSKDTLPLCATTASVEGAKGPSKRQTPFLARTRQRPSNPQRSRSDPHLFRRHRSLPRAVPAALAHTAAAVRHLRHLQAFRPAHSQCVTSGPVVTTRLPQRFWFQEAPQIDPANGFGGVFM